MKKKLQQNQLDGLVTLKVVSEEGSFTAAARRLGVTASAVSQAIKNLEIRLGVAVLSRTTRSTSLTEAGKRFLNETGAALDQILNSIDNISRYSDKPSGVLRLNMPHQVFPTAMSSMISSFTQKYPEIRVEIVFDNMAIDIVANGFDAGIRLSDILMADMVAIKILGPAKWIVAGSPRYFERVGRPKHPKDLLKHNCICVGVDGLVYDHWEFEQDGKEFNVEVSGSIVLSNPHFTYYPAIEGAGLIYTLKESIDDKIESGELEIVLEHYAATSAGFYLYYPARSQVLPKLRVFIDHLNEQMKKRRLARR